MRPPFLEANGKTVTQAWKDAYRFRVEHPKFGVHEYVPTAKGLDFHESVCPNELIEGSRGTGKSMIIRNDAHMKAMAYAGYTYLIVRRTMPELKKSHLRFIGIEMKRMGGYFHRTDNIAYYPNGSQGFFSHCETEDDMMKLLSSEYSAIYFDEISTFTWVMITKIASCARVADDSGLIAIVRGGTNPIGIGAGEVRRYFITKDVSPEEDPDYDPSEYHSIHTTLDDNPHIDKAQYIKRLSMLPEHIKRAWLDGEWIVEGAYFHDYRPSKKVLSADLELLQTHVLGETIAWHVSSTYPVVKDKQAHLIKWIHIYRALDWGFSPNPCVCLWIAMLPNGRAFVLKERSWKSTPAAQVAKDIIEDSKGMHIVDTYCDPSMFFGSEATDSMSIGDIFEDNGVWLTPSQNDRAAAGFAIHEYLNTILIDGFPKIQIYEFGCPMLLRTLPEMRVHKTDPKKIADGADDWVIALAYFCMSRVGTSREHITSNTPRWMKPKKAKMRRLGTESVRRGVRAR